MRKLKTQKGITLVALIITIVVLLILAAVAIGAVRNSDIIGYAQNAAEGYETEKGKENEAIKGAEDLLSKYANGENGGSIEASVLLAKFTENPEAFKHPEQSSGNGARAIGTDGTPVNMDWWEYIEDKNNKTIALSLYTGSAPDTSYTGDIKEGCIVGSVPQYIKLAESDIIYTVTSMNSAFRYVNNLKIAPQIPSTVTDMSYTFEGCESLITPPTIPNSVTNMEYTFAYCTSLTEAPEIPGMVTNMYSTFDGCKSLTKAPEIPSTVTNMVRTFSLCESLTTPPTIPNGVTDMENTFSSCTSLTEAPEIPSTVTNMYSTFSGCKSLIKAPTTIPSSVRSMDFTFQECTNLTEAPIIQNGVETMYATFVSCTSLTEAPTIPNSVTSMVGTFGNCTSLRGTLRIETINLNYGSLGIENSNINKIQVPANSVTETTIRAAYPEITIEAF